LTFRAPPSPPLFPYTTLFRSHYQLAMTFFSSLTFLPAALLARRFGGCRGAVTALALLFMVNPMFLENATFAWTKLPAAFFVLGRSEEHTSELQSLTNLVCRLL